MIRDSSSVPLPQALEDRRHAHSPLSRRKSGKLSKILSPDAAVADTLDFIPSDVITMGFNRSRTASRSANDRRLSMPHIAGSTSRRQVSSAQLSRATSTGALSFIKQSPSSGTARSLSAASTTISPQSSPRLRLLSHEISPRSSPNNSPKQRRGQSLNSLPSQPSRWEALILAEGKSAKVQMEKLLTAGGFDHVAPSQIGPEQIEDLSKIITEEHEIYQEVLSKIVDEVNPEQADTLSAVRDHYKNLFARVPRQVSAIGQDLLQSKALNQEFTKEIVRVDRAISEVTKSIDDIIKTDKGKQSFEKVSLRFKDSIAESESALKVLRQLETLYDLQRQRLQSEATELQDNCDDWVSVSKKLCSRLCDSRSRAGTDAVVLCAKSWCTTALKLVSAITARDESLTNRIEETLSTWRTCLTRMVRWIAKVNSVGYPIINQACNQISEHHFVLEKAPEEARVDILASTEKTVLEIAQLVESRLDFLAEIDPGPAEYLATLLSSWCDDTYKLMECHPTIDKSLQTEMFNVNKLSVDIADKVVPAMTTARQNIVQLRSLKTILDRWLRDQDDPYSKLVNSTAWTTFLIRFEKLKEEAQKIVILASDHGRERPPLQVDSKKWGFTSMNWTIQVRSAVAVATGTVEAQVSKAQNLLKEWSVIVDLCLAGVTEGHPDIVESKYIRTWSLVQNMTGIIEDSARANIQAFTTPSNTSVGLDATDLSVDSLYGKVVELSDLATLRDDATDFNEKATVLMRRLRENYRSPVLQDDSTAEPKFMKSKGAMLVPSEDGELFQITIPGAGEIHEMLSTLRNAPTGLAGQDRQEAAAAKIAIRAEERLEGLRTLVASQLKEHMPTEVYDALPIWQKLAGDAPK